MFISEVENPNVDIISWATEKKENKSLSEQNVALYKTESENDIIKLEFKFADQKWVNENTDTFVIYSCSEGLSVMTQSIPQNTSCNENITLSTTVKDKNFWFYVQIFTVFFRENIDYSRNFDEIVIFLANISLTTRIDT